MVAKPTRKRKNFSESPNACAFSAVFLTLALAEGFLPTRVNSSLTGSICWTSMLLIRQDFDPLKKSPVTSWLLFVYPSSRWGVWGYHLPLLFSGLVQLPVIVTRKMCCQGCGVAMVMTPVPVFASGHFWPSPTRGLCASGAAPGRGWRAGIVLFGAISASSSMVASVF